jgi:hypothetical protein
MLVGFSFLGRLCYQAGNSWRAWLLLLRDIQAEWRWCGWSSDGVVRGGCLEDSLAQT